MKTQTSIIYRWRSHESTAFMNLDIYERAQNTFLEMRMNGDEKLDTPDYKDFGDGEITWAKGRIDAEDKRLVYGVKENDGFFHYACRYELGHELGRYCGLNFILTTDCNYLTRILREGNLQKFEPDVYYLLALDPDAKLEYATDGSISSSYNIASWWLNQIAQPDVAARLAKAYMNFVSNELAPYLIKELKNICLEYVVPPLAQRGTKEVILAASTSFWTQAPTTQVASSTSTEEAGFTLRINFNNG